MPSSSEQMPRHDRGIMMLKQVQAEIDSTEKLGHLYTCVCEIVVGVGGYCMAWIGLAENDLAKSIRAVAHAGYESGYLDYTNLTWAATESGLGPGGTAIRESRIQINNSISRSSHMGFWREEALKRGYAACIAAPLKERSGLAFGALIIYAIEENAFADEEILIVSQLADKLSAAVINLRLKVHDALGPPHHY
jgi:GAF domain-containing protein